MMLPNKDAFVIRDLDAGREADLEWVARAMHATLVEVEGEKGRQNYPVHWTRARLRELLDPRRRYPARVLLAVAPFDAAHILGHTILRVNEMPDGRLYGLISTTYVDPAHRRVGIAKALLDRAETWVRAHGMDEAATWTSAANLSLIRLYERHGYVVTEEALNEGTMMLRLAKAVLPDWPVVIKT